MDSSITTATETGGGLLLASFGSGDTGGRLQARARGTARNQSASAAEVRALRSRITRQGTAGNSAAARERRRLLQEIADNTNSRGNIRRGVLADIAADLADL